MAGLVIQEVIYNGDKWQYSSPQLGPGLHILRGENGAGKTTFMDLIYYGLSGNPIQFKSDKKSQHKEIMSDTNNFVKLKIKIDEKSYTLKRFFNNNEITIYDSNGEVEICQLNRGPNTPYIFSDWLLQQLNIEVIEIFHGHLTWKLNVLDLFRLFYHDQELNPRRIYKTPDIENFVTDSELIRNTIFEMLIGKNYSDYYRSISEFKELESRLRAEQITLNDYDERANAIRGDKNVINLVHLNVEREKILSQLERLNKSRSAIKNNRPKDTENFDRVEELKAQYVELEQSLQEIEDQESELITERFKYRQLQEDLIRETTQIQKIIHTHEELSLFTPDTCPYCLRPVDRDHGKCVCGKDIDEEEYEKFFYDSEEYLEILKSKKKSVETVNEALNSIQAELNTQLSQKEKVKEGKSQIQSSIESLVSRVEGSVDVEALNKIDDEILDKKEVLQNINRQIEIEQKRDAQQKKVDRIKDDFDKKKREMKALKIQAEEDIQEKVKQFDTKYKELMMNSLSTCRSARLDEENYMPIINEGEYSQASAGVPKRLNYYLTLLHLSIQNPDVKFPRFILIDTPRTAGIERENLIKCLEQIENVVDLTKNNFQILLSTGMNSYPQKYEDYIFDTITEDDKLLEQI